MEQKNILNNISGTVFVVGLVLSTMNLNSTMLIDGYKKADVDYSFYSYDKSPTNFYNVTSYNYIETREVSQLEAEATSLFGTMRDATPEEQESVNNYIKSISRKTGVNFFDLC